MFIPDPIFVLKSLSMYYEKYNTYCYFYLALGVFKIIGSWQVALDASIAIATLLDPIILLVILLLESANAKKDLEEGRVMNVWNCIMEIRKSVIASHVTVMS